MVYGQQVQASEQTPRRGVVVIDFDDNLIFEGEVVGRQIDWLWGVQAELTALTETAPETEAAAKAPAADPKVADTRLAA